MRTCIVVGLIVLARTATAQPAPPSPLSPPETTPAAPRVGRFAFGVGETLLIGDHVGLVDYFTAGVRVTARNWITVRFGHGRSVGREGSYAPDETTYYDGGVLATRMRCATSGRLCGAVTGGAGYEHVRFALVNDIDNDAPPIFYLKEKRAFAEARGAVRLNFGYVWLEASLGMRAHVRLDRDEDDIDRDLVLGVAVHVTP